MEERDSSSSVGSKLEWCSHYAKDFPGGSDSKASAYTAGDPGLIPESGRYSAECNGNPLQYSCLENPMVREHGRLQSMGSQRVGLDWVTSYSLSPWKTVWRFLKKLKMQLPCDSAILLLGMYPDIYIYIILFTHKEEENSATCNNVDETRGHCVEWNKSGKDK